MTSKRTWSNIMLFLKTSRETEVPVPFGLQKRCPRQATYHRIFEVGQQKTAKTLAVSLGQDRQRHRDPTTLSHYTSRLKQKTLLSTNINLILPSSGQETGQIALGLHQQAERGVRDKLRWEIPANHAGNRTALLQTAQTWVGEERSSSESLRCSPLSCPKLQPKGQVQENTTKSSSCCSVLFLRGSRLLRLYAAPKVVKEASPKSVKLQGQCNGFGCCVQYSTGNNWNVSGNSLKGRHVGSFQCVQDTCRGQKKGESGKS